MIIIMIHIGCSGFYYNDWIGKFYPVSLNSSEYLKYYSEYFNTVEINSSFYNYPRREVIESWIRQFNNSNFVFSFKFPRDVTHNPEGINNDSIELAVEFQDDVMKKFYNNNILGAGLIQLSPFFEPGRVNDWDKRLTDLLESLDVQKYRIAVEFRNIKFFRGENLEILKKLIIRHNISIVSVDSPGLPFIHIEGSPFSYIRLHGRNSDLWFGGNDMKGRMNKYDYLYSYNELLEISKKINTIRDGDLYIYFNNHAQSKAAQNAIRFAEILGIKINRSLNQKTLIDY